MNTRKRKENLLEHTVPADKPPKREKIDEGATTKLVMDALTNLSQSVNDSEQLQHYLPDVQDLKTLDARGHVSGGIIRFWSNYLIHNVINNTAGSNSKQDIIIDCHWMGTLYFHSNRKESTLMDSLEETVRYFEDDDVVWKDLTIANSKLVFIPYSILNDHWSLLVICNLNKLKVRM
jgi:Ulp1 family protease